MKKIFNRRNVIIGLLASGTATSIPAQGQEDMLLDLSNVPEQFRASAEAAYKKLIAEFPYERIEVPGADIAGEWERLRKLGRGWPVIVGNADKFIKLADQYHIFSPEGYKELSNIEGFPKPRSVEEILKISNNIRFPDDISKAPGAYSPEELSAKVGDWPNLGEFSDDAPGISLASDSLTGKPLDKVQVIFIPTENSWEIPAFLYWGGWNACPPPEYHVAALKHWHEKYGLELVGINGDSMDMRISRPPKDKDEAISVAKDIYLYCPDIVDQGTDNLSTLAAIMVTRNWWTFWWD